MGITTIFSKKKTGLLLCLIALSFISCGKKNEDNEITDAIGVPEVSAAPVYEAPKKHKFTIAVPEFAVDSDVNGKLKAEARERILTGLKNNSSAGEIDFTDTFNANTDCIVTGIIFSQNVVNMNKSLVVTSYNITVSCIEAHSKNTIDSWTLNSSQSLETAGMSMKLLSPDLYLQRASLYTERHYYDLAITDYNTALQMAPNLKGQVQTGIADTLVKQGNASIDTEDYAAAKAAYTGALDLDSNAKNAILNKANSCYEQEKYAAAVEIYDLITGRITEADDTIELNTILIRSYIIKSDMSFLKNEFDFAVTYLNKALDINPDDTDVLEARALVYLQTKDYDLAIADYTKCIETDPSTGYYMDRANAYSEMGNFTQSIADYTFILANDDNPDTVAEARLSRGAAYLKAKDYTNSIKDYSDYLRYKPKPSLPLVYIMRSIAYKDSGSTDLALADLKTAETYDAAMLKEYDMADLYIALADKVYDMAGGDDTMKAFDETLGNKLNKGLSKKAPMPVFPEEYNVIIDCLEKAVSYDNESENKSRLSNWLLSRAHTRHLNSEFKAAVTDYEKAKELSGGLDKVDKARLKRASKEKGIFGGLGVLFWIIIIAIVIIGIVVVILSL